MFPMLLFCSLNYFGLTWWYFLRSHIGVGEPFTQAYFTNKGTELYCLVIKVCCFAVHLALPDLALFFNFLLVRLRLAAVIVH